jgi:hypothetical protein
MTDVTRLLENPMGATVIVQLKKRKKKQKEG